MAAGLGALRDHAIGARGRSLRGLLRSGDGHEHGDIRLVQARDQQRRWTPEHERRHLRSHPHHHLDLVGELVVVKARLSHLHADLLSLGSHRGDVIRIRGGVRGLGRRREQVDSHRARGGAAAKLHDLLLDRLGALVAGGQEPEPARLRNGNGKIDRGGAPGKWCEHDRHLEAAEELMCAVGHEGEQADRGQRVSSDDATVAAPAAGGSWSARGRR